MLAVETIQGRQISSVEIAEIQALIQSHSGWSRWRLSRSLAQRWQWYAASGELKDMAARTLLLKRQARGFIVLPPRRRAPIARARDPGPELFDSPPPEPVGGTLSSLRPLQVHVVRPQQPEFRLFRRYLPIDQHGANLLFQVISQRYERGSTILTTNKPFKHWPSIFNNDSTITSAVLDRLLHHADTVVIEGPSYRMKDKAES